MTATSISLAIFFNYKVLMSLRNDTFHKEERFIYRGIQKTLIVQLASHAFMLSVPFIGLVMFTIFEIPYLLPFTAMMECGPTITTTLTLISVPEYRRKLNMCFNKTVKPLVNAY